MPLLNREFCASNAKQLKIFFQLILIFHLLFTFNFRCLFTVITIWIYTIMWNSSNISLYKLSFWNQYQTIVSTTCGPTILLCLIDAFLLADLKRVENFRFNSASSCLTWLILNVDCGRRIARFRDLLNRSLKSYERNSRKMYS